MTAPIINDLEINGKFRVYDINKGHYLYSLLSLDGFDDFPPDVAVLPVLGLRAVDDVLIIDTATN